MRGLLRMAAAHRKHRRGRGVEQRLAGSLGDAARSSGRERGLGSVRGMGEAGKAGAGGKMM